MIKRTSAIIVLAALLLAPGMLFASGAQEATGKVDKITFWTWGNTKSFEWVWDRFIEDYPEYSTIELEVHSTGGHTIEMVKQLMVSFAAGADLPDTTEMNFKMNSALVQDGVVQDITKAIGDNKKFLPPANIAIGSYEGKLYGYPLRSNTSMMMYRKDFLKEAGLSPDDMKTYDGYISTGKKVRAMRPDTYWTEVSPKQPVNWWSEMMAGQYGLGWYDKKTGECIVDTDPRIMNTFKTVDRFMKEDVGYLMHSFTPPWWAALKEGKQATILAAGWMPSILANNVPDGKGKWAATGYPTFENGKQSLQGAAGFVILTKDRAKLDVLTKAYNNAFFVEKNAYDFEAARTMSSQMTFFKDNPPKQKVMEDYYPEQDIYKLHFKLLDEALVHHYTPAFAETLDILNMEMAKVVTGEKDVATAIKDMGKTIRLKIGKSLY